MRMRMWLGGALLLAVAAATGAPPGARAGDGRHEISQAAVEAAGGFPYVIAGPGSYVLTGELQVPAGTNGIEVRAEDVSIDLNGFAVRGTFVCGPEGCSAGPGDGVSSPTSSASTTLRNGRVVGFGARCVDLGAGSTVDRVTARNCGGDCIALSTGGQVLASRALSCGGAGLSTFGAGLYADTLIQLTGRAGPSPVVIGAWRGSGNVCDPGTCPGTPAPPRPFYLTQTTHTGATAKRACAAGFHMASMWEVLDPTVLRYDSELGVTTEDSGAGPPTERGGWIRTGKPSDLFSNSPGGASCAGYTTTNGSGTQAILRAVWTVPTTGELVQPWWRGTTPACSGTHRVWCIED